MRASPQNTMAIRWITGAIRLTILTAILFIAAPGLVIDVAASALFDDTSVLEVKLSGPLDKVISDTRNRAELPFILTANGQSHSIKVKVRGNSRVRACDFPPLRLNFTSADTADTVFAEQDKLKLVTHCGESERAEKNALEEYAAYRIFNLISELSYNVRLLRITYVDSNRSGEDELLERYGFLIESESELSSRTGSNQLQVIGVSRRLLDSDQAAAVFVFQYLIGNSDWSLVTGKDEHTCCHNGDLFDIQERIFYVPYDFDLAGLINARYAYPDPSLPIRKVTQRIYRGLCMPTDTIRGAIGTINRLKPQINDVLRESAGLSEKEVEANIDYLNQFFDKAENEEKLIRLIDRQCLRPG